MLPDTFERRMNSIPGLSRQGKPVNGLFRLLKCPELWRRAYEGIARNDSALSPGSTQNTLDGFSLERVASIIEALKDGSYCPVPVRRVHIPKPNGKTRPLGVHREMAEGSKGVESRMGGRLSRPVRWG